MLTFDDYLSNRVKLGKSQYVSFLILSLIEFMAGFQEIFQAILVRLLKMEWGISIDEQAYLSVLFFTGITIGNLVCSVMADKIGRKTILMISQTCAILMMVFNSFAQDYIWAAITIFIYGIVFGVSMPISQVMASEIAPVKVRGRFLVMLQFIYILGILHLIIQCQIFLDSLDSGDWRTLLRVNTAIPGLCLILSMVFLIDSPRLYITKGNYEDGFKLLDKMGKSNNKDYVPMTNEEKERMIRWNKSFNVGKSRNIGFSDLFKKKTLIITIFILLIFVCYNMVACGIIIITPYLLGEADKSFLDLFYAYAVEIPAIILVLLLFENKIWGGRIKCTIYGLIIMTTIQVLLIFFQYDIISIGVMALRFSFRIVWSGLNALPAESYSTHLRSLGVGAAHGTGKIAGALSSFAVLPLFYHSDFLPFYFGACLSFLCIVILIFYPVDATQKALDLKSSSLIVSEILVNDDEEIDDDDNEDNDDIRKQSEEALISGK